MKLTVTITRIAQFEIELPDNTFAQTTSEEETQKRVCDAINAQELSDEDYGWDDTSVADEDGNEVWSMS